MTETKIASFNETAQIGKGVFTLTDAAKILGLKKHQIKYWIDRYANQRYYKHNKARLYFGDEDDIRINFYALIEIFVFYTLRDRKIKPKVIVEAHAELSRIYKTKYPFASATILTSSHDILFQDDDGAIIKADKTKQHYLEKVISEFSHKIEFDSVNKQAVRYFPLGKDKKIVVDPHHQFGAPVIIGTNIKAEVVYGLYLGGDSKKSIARLYDIEEKAVVDAITYCKAA